MLAGVCNADTAGVPLIFLCSKSGDKEDCRSVTFRNNPGIGRWVVNLVDKTHHVQRHGSICPGFGLRSQAMSCMAFSCLYTPQKERKNLETLKGHTFQEVEPAGTLGSLSAENKF